MPIDVILVPQGFEYQAVCRGLRGISNPKPLVQQIPAGWEPASRYLEQLQQAGYFLQYEQPKVLLVGLCGSLSPNHGIGDIVLYQECIDLKTVSVEKCDRSLTTLLHHTLQEKATVVRGLTSDRFIYSGAEKSQLGEIYNAGVVDMEGFATLEVLSRANIAVAMLRVISDDSHHDLPNLEQALSSDGSIQPLALAIALFKQPFAATRLIQGSLRGLRVLQQLVRFIFSEN